jgi:hypothetical protein
MAAVLLATFAVGGALIWLAVPVVYVDLFRIYEDAGAGPRSNALAIRAVQLESPTFVATAVAPMIASGRLTAGDVQKAIVHAEVGRRDDIITVSVQHGNPQVAAAISNALVSATVARQQGVPPAPANPTTESAKSRLARAVAAVVTRTVVLQPPQTASQLKPQLNRLGWTLSALCMGIPAIIAVFTFRKWIFATDPKES